MAGIQHHQDSALHLGERLFDFIIRNAGLFDIREIGSVRTEVERPFLAFDAVAREEDDGYVLRLHVLSQRIEFRQNVRLGRLGIQEQFGTHATVGRGTALLEDLANSLGIVGGTVQLPIAGIAIDADGKDMQARLGLAGIGIRDVVRTG